jgi:hypothetical protein
VQALLSLFGGLAEQHLLDRTACDQFVELFIVVRVPHICAEDAGKWPMIARAERLSRSDLTGNAQFHLSSPDRGRSAPSCKRRARTVRAMALSLNFYRE